MSEHLGALHRIDWAAIGAQVEKAMEPLRVWAGRTTAELAAQVKVLRGATGSRSRAKAAGIDAARLRSKINRRAEWEAFAHRSGIAPTAQRYAPAPGASEGEV